MARILIADDETEVRELIRYALEKDGHKVFETSTGSETLNFVMSKPVDLVVLDVMLPGMDGYTLQFQMAQNEKTCDIPVIVISALHPTKDMFSKFSQVREFVMKPFDPVELSRKVEQVLAGAAKT